MKKVLLRAPVLTQSGYGVHSRQVARWLLDYKDIDLTIQALPWGDTPWIVDADRMDGLVGRIMQRCGDPKGKNFDVTFQVQLPNEWDPKLGTHNVGITAAIETDRCNPNWISCCNAMNHVIVPSNHAKKSLTNTGDINVPLDVLPEAYSDACAKETKKIPDDQFSTDFNFLVFGQITGDNPFNDRKNTFFTLKWLFEEFKDDKNVGIVLKTNTGRNTLIDKNKVKMMMERVIQESRVGKYPRLHIVHGDMTDDEVVGLYKHAQVKALVSATRGEGFGLPLLEASACGLPVIATDWSGHLDFMRKGKFVSIFYDVKDVHKSRIDGNIFTSGMRWAEPSEVDFKKRIRKFYNSSSIPKKWALDLSKRIIEGYSFDNIATMYSVKFEGVLKDA